MNNDTSVTGCFVQLPVPDHLQDINITELINPKKDVDGFHSKNIIALYNNDPNLVSCTPKGIVELLKFYHISIESKNITIIGRGFIVGKPLALLLQAHNATVTLCHSKTTDIKKYTRSADIIISAIGKPKFLTSDFLGQNKDQIVIDVGINRDEQNSLCGDVDYDEVVNKVQAITPVPGGVGPMTVYSLINNLIQATKNILNEKKNEN
jgi:methylenetetrahydrofolate dehydrogenase (NADP+)/methenyltetrahydrofolate cyclohydrolase